MQRHWFALAIMLTVQVIGSLTFLAVTALTPFIKAEFALSSSAVGVLIVALYLGYFLTLIPGGVLTDVFGERLSLGLGLGLVGLFAIVIGASVSPWMLGVGLFALGCGYSTIPSGTSKGVFDWFPPEKLGFGLGIKQTGVMLGGAISAAALPALAAREGWRIAFSAAGLLAVLGLGLLVVYSRPDGKGGTKADAAETAIGAFRSQAQGIVTVYTETSLTPLLFVGVLFGAGQFTLAAYAVLYLTEQISLTPTVAGLLYTIMQLAGVGSRILFGYVADRWLLQRRELLLFGIGVAGFLAYLVLALLPSDAPLSVVGITVTLVGALSFGYNGVYLTIASELVGAEHAGFSTSIAITAVMVGALVTPPVFGLLADVTGAYVIPIGLLAGITLLAGLFSNRIESDTERSRAESVG